MNVPGWYDTFVTEDTFPRIMISDDVDKIEHVIFDESLFPIWGEGYFGEDAAWRADDDGLIYLDRWFEGCTNLTEIEGLENIYTGDALTMAAMFKDCSAIEELDISSFDTSKCENFEDMFAGCESLITLKTGKDWTQSGVDAAQAAGKEDCEKATFPHDMFCMRGEKKVVYLQGEAIPDGEAEYTVANREYINPATMLLRDAAADSSTAFTPALTCEYTGEQIQPEVQVTIDGKLLEAGVDYTTSYTKNIDTGKGYVTVTGIGAYFGTKTVSFTIQDTGAYMFLYNNGLLVLKAQHDPLGNDVVSSSLGLVGVKRWFDSKTPNPGSTVPWAEYGPNAVKSVLIDSSFATLRPTTAEGWFEGCESLKTITGLNYLNLSSVTSLKSMFKGCSSLTSLPLYYMDLSSITDMSDMFRDCTSLKSVTMQYVQWPKAENLSGFFRGCTALTDVNIDLTLPSAINLNGFFRDCTALTNVNIKNIKANNATNLGMFFKGCTSLVELDISELSAPEATNVDAFLNGCTSLETLTLGGLASAGKADMSALISKCPKLNTLATASAWRNATTDSSKLKFASRSYRMKPSCARKEAGTAVPSGAAEYRLHDLALQFTTVTMKSSDYTCTGKAIKPNVKVKLGGVVLQQGKDYTISYKNNVYPGKASMTIQGKGIFTGGLVVPFTISARVTNVGDRLIYETSAVKFTLKVTKVKKQTATAASVDAMLVDAQVKSTKLKTMSIPDQCTISGVKVDITAVTSKLTGKFRNVTCVAIGAKVTTIGARAFAKAPKVKKLLVKSSRLKSVKNCLKGSKVRNVETRVYLSKTKKATYKKWFTKQSGKTGVKFTYGIYFVAI